LNQNLSRTLVTSLTTLLALVALFVIAGGAIRGFTVALIWGVLIGTYSSLYIATPALLALNMRPESEPETPEGEPAEGELELGKVEAPPVPKKRRRIFEV
jgi:preprotein translocase subunit SecF